MLALEIEWLTGVCVAAHTPADETPQWPVQPDRLFSALVATWGAHGSPQYERAALEWLEALDPPHIEAAEAVGRFVASVFVPPNDIATLPDHRRRQPRRFPASIISAMPGEPHMRILWDDADGATHFDALQALARDTSYVGHSSALVRCLFMSGTNRVSSLKPRDTRAAPYRGRLKELEDLHVRHNKGEAGARPAPAILSPAIGKARPSTTPRSVFGRNWIILEATDGERPDIRAAAGIARAMRDALMGAFPDPVPEWLSGHSADGAPSTKPHLAVAPLANVGWDRSDGRLMGVALILPRHLEEQWREDAPATFQEKRAFERALANLLVAGVEKTDEEAITLKLGAAGLWRLQRAQGSQVKSLSPARYCARSRVWASATPIALDRFTKTEGPARLEEAAQIIGEGCSRVGLKAGVGVRVHKHSALRGAPSAWPVGGAPAWTGWARPKALASRPLFHATIQFEEPVRGPVILGAGRFFGLGLCLPLGEKT